MSDKNYLRNGLADLVSRGLTRELATAFFDAREEYAARVDNGYKALRQTLRDHLPAILDNLPGPVDTRRIVSELAWATGLDETRVSGQILAIARDHPQARQDGETFTRYGKELHRWTWYPTPQ